MVLLRNVLILWERIFHAAGILRLESTAYIENPIMPVQHAPLTSPLEKPSLGHGFARRFDKSIDYFWSAAHQRIYHELERMAKAG